MFRLKLLLWPQKQKQFENVWICCSFLCWLAVPAGQIMYCIFSTSAVAFLWKRKLLPSLHPDKRVMAPQKCPILCSEVVTDTMITWFWSHLTEMLNVSEYIGGFWNTCFNHLNMYSLFCGCQTPPERMCLQVQSELRRWLRKCHNQSHLTPAKRSITQITIRTREGLAGPPSSGNISSVWSFNDYPLGSSCPVEHQRPLSKLQTPSGIISTTHLRKPYSEHCWELRQRHQQLELWQQTLFIECVLLPVLWNTAAMADVAREELRRAGFVGMSLQRCRKTRPEGRQSWSEMQAGVMALRCRESERKQEQMLMNYTGASAETKQATHWK